MKLLRSAEATLAGMLAATPAYTASAEVGSDALPWLVLGSIGVVVVAIVFRMVYAARFPKGYREWAQRRRDTFAKQNEQWDRADEEFRK